MQTSQLFRVIACFLFLVISSNLVAKASYVEIERKFLNANWSFVPEVPQAFKESRNENHQHYIKKPRTQAQIYC